MTTIAEIHEILDRTARRDEEYRAADERRRAEAEKRRLEAEQQMAELRAILAESARNDEERKAEWRRERVEMRASRRKTDEAIRKSVNQFDKNWGNLVEAFANNQLIELFVDRGIDVTDNSTRNAVGTIAGRLYEIDSILTNSDTAVMIEAKTTLNQDDVGKFLFKLRNCREGFPILARYPIILGGLAYIRGKPEAVQYAQENGLFTILATGKSAKIVNADNFEPQKWGV